MLGHLILQRCQGPPQLRITRLGLVHAHLVLSPQLLQAPVAATCHAIQAVVHGILLVVMLVIVLRRVKRGGAEQGGGDGLPEPLLERTQRRSEERRVGKECRSRWSPYH